MPEIQQIKEQLLSKLDQLNKRVNEIDSELRVPGDDDFSEIAS